MMSEHDEKEDQIQQENVAKKADEISAHVIMLNDFPEFVHIGTKRDAEKKMVMLASADYNSKIKYLNNFNSFDQYRERHNWHIESVLSNAT